MTSKILKIFISQNVKDRQHPAAIWILNALKKNEYLDLWIDDNNLTAGESLVGTIERAISESDYMIQFISQESIGSRWTGIESELAYATQLKTQNLKIIQLLLPDINSKRSSTIGKGRRGMVIQVSDNFEESLNKLMEILNLDGESLVKFGTDSIIETKTIIDITSEVNSKLIKYFSLHPKKLKTMNRRLFEELIAELFSGFGFNVELTQKTRDGGRDVIAIKKAETNLKYLIECKRPDPENPVGIKPVRELLGVKQDEKATKAISIWRRSPDLLPFAAKL